MLKTEPEFKMKWYKSIFAYSVRHKKSLGELEKHFSEKELRRLVESAEVKLMKGGEIELMQFGGYVFEGEVVSDGVAYTKEKFISQQKTVKAMNDVILLKFKTVGIIEPKNNERMSVFNER